MAVTIDWMYRRNFCDTCEKAETFLEQHGVRVKSTTDARKEKMNQAALLALAKSVDVILTVKGKNCFDVGSEESQARPEGNPGCHAGANRQPACSDVSKRQDALRGVSA